MKLIERYLYAIKKYLPEEIREDVGMELRANIEDMLPDDYTEEDAYQVLTKLGSPRKLADDYNTQKRYLIGPGYYDMYLSMLKKVIGIFVLAAVGIACLGWIIESPIDWYQSENITKLFVNLFSSFIMGAAQGAFWVTLVFIILERTGVEAGYIPMFNKEWTPADLPELPVGNRMKISRGNTILTMFSTILFTTFVYFRPQLIAIYLLGKNNRVDITPLFDVERLQFYLPIIVVFALFQLGMFIWKLITEDWNLQLAILNSVYSVASCVLVVVMLSDNSLINTEFISVLGRLINVSISVVSPWITKSKWIFGFVFIGICAWDSAVILARCLRKSPTISQN